MSPRKLGSWVAGRLPSDTTGWCSVVNAALGIPYSSLTIPSHFRLKSLGTNDNVSFSSYEVEKEITKESAVLLLLAPVVTSHGLDFCIPLTMRTSLMRAHKGQMALPGGRCDAGETAEDAASRETFEEIGIPATAYTVIGRLKRVWSYPSKSWVTPVVAVATSEIHPSIASPTEVESLHYLHLRSLLEHSATTHLRLERYFSPRSGGPISMPCFFASSDMRQPLDVVVAPSVVAGDATPTTTTSPSVGSEALISQDKCAGTLVWGLTAFILCEFLSRIFAQLATSTTTTAMTAGATPTDWHSQIPRANFVVSDPELSDAKRRELIEDATRASPRAKL